MKLSQKLHLSTKDSNRMKQLVLATGDFNFIIQSLQPISTVDEHSFCNLLATADPKFKLPHRVHFSTKVISDMYDVVCSKVEKQLSAVHYCTITSNLWTAGYQNHS